MKLRGLDPSDLEALERALRRGEPVYLDLQADLPPELRADQLLPCFEGAITRTPRFTEALREHLPLPGRDPSEPLSVTAIIPTHRHTPVGLEALRAQDCDLEVMVLANGQVDGVRGDRVLRVPWGGHGATRMEGVRAATTDYVLLTVDDALPRGAGCVRALVEALEEGGYDAVFGRQVPWPGADPVTRERLQSWTPAGRGHWPVERLDNVFALYRRDTLLEHPLPSVPIGEDLHWRQGRRVGYVPAAVVVHSHPRQARELYRRTRDLHLQHQLLGEPPRVASLAGVIGALPGLVRPVLQAGPGELRCQLAELLGQWRATRLARRP